MRRSVLAALAAVANIYFQFGGTGYHEVDAEQNPLLHTWSLGVEEQFYLAIALLFVLLWRLARRAAPVMVIVATGISFVFWIMMIRGGGSFERPDSIAFYSTFARVWEFGVGLLLALTIIQRQVPALIVALAWFVLAASMVIPETHDVLLPVVVVASGTLLIAALSFRFAARSSGSVIVRTAVPVAPAVHRFLACCSARSRRLLVRCGTSVDHSCVRLAPFHRTAPPPPTATIGGPAAARPRRLRHGFLCDSSGMLMQPLDAEGRT